MNLLAFSHAREDDESRRRQRARDSLRARSILLVSDSFSLSASHLCLSFLSRHISSCVYAHTYFFFASLVPRISSFPLSFFYPPFILRRKPRISDIKRSVRRRNAAEISQALSHRCDINAGYATVGLSKLLK